MYETASGSATTDKATKRYNTTRAHPDSIRRFWIRSGAVNDRRQRVGFVVALALVGPLAVSAGSASGGTAARVTVTPLVSAADEPIRIVVRGLASAERATVAVTSVDDANVPWASSATFRADGAGVVDVNRMGPADGSYEGVWSMGLIAMMTTVKPDPAGAYFWSRAHAETFTVTIRSHGRVVASTTFRRRFARRPIRVEHERLSTHGFYGNYFVPHGSGRQPAVLAFGGSEGGIFGMSLVSALLAAHGHPTLDIAYFKEPGLPQTLSKIPLEYFAKALRWLRLQPNVDPNRIVVVGASRGSEAAELLGVHYPNLVHAVVAYVPSNVALCGWPDCSEPAWTLHGQPLPYTHEFDTPNPTDNPAAVIPVERIRGPVFLACAGRDTVWVSCPFAEAIMRRLNAQRDGYRHVLYRYANADHLIGFMPYEPVAAGDDRSTEIAREHVWPHLLAFLNAVR
jgi:dienelactone hydrolase